MATLHKTLPAETTWVRLRRTALWMLFAGILLIPKVLRLRRRARVWNAGRLIAAVLGAGLLAAFAAVRLHVAGVVAGAVLVLLALLLGPERSRSSSAAATDALAKELGAMIVVRGGTYRAADGKAIETRFFVGPQRLCILQTASDPLFVVPVADLSALRAEPAEGGWKLSLAWGTAAADFFYQGPFAEHFARVAESTVRSQMPGTLHVLR